MQRVRIVIALTLGLLWVLLAAPPLGAQPGPHRGPGGGPGGGPDTGREAPDEPPGRFIAEHAEELGLSDEARAEIEAIVRRSHERSRELRQAHRQAAQALHQLLELDEPDRATVMSQADVVGGLESQRRKLRLGAMLDIRSLLTPEQRRQLVEIRPPDRFDRREERRQRMRSCRPDAERLCTDTDRPRDVLQCLRKHRDELSSECGDALTELERHQPWRRHRRVFFARPRSFSLQPLVRPCSFPLSSSPHSPPQPANRERGRAPTGTSIRRSGSSI